jgi:hypothetical protein
VNPNYKYLKIIDIIKLKIAFSTFMHPTVHFNFMSNAYLGYSDRTSTRAKPASSLHAASLLVSRLPRPVFIEGIERVDTGFRSCNGKK